MATTASTVWGSPYLGVAAVASLRDHWRWTVLCRRCLLGELSPMFWLGFSWRADEDSSHKSRPLPGERTSRHRLHNVRAPSEFSARPSALCGAVAELRFPTPLNGRGSCSLGLCLRRSTHIPHRSHFPHLRSHPPQPSKQKATVQMVTRAFPWL